tara:strand:- start:1318 stop:1533 length:216 start_codon:yes stop_codon:yes gene_type:complete
MESEMNNVDKKIAKYVAWGYEGNHFAILQEQSMLKCDFMQSDDAAEKQEINDALEALDVLEMPILEEIMGA